MIRCFRKSIIVMAAIAAAAAALELYIIFFKDFILIWTRPLAALMIAALGILAARVAGNLVASAENTKILGYLFRDMDPDKFVSAYGPVAEKTRKGSFDSFSAYAYLADGCSASGNPGKSIEIIDRAYDDAKDKGKILPYYRTNRLRYLLASGRYDEADREYDKLMEDVSGKAPALRANIEKVSQPMKEFLDAYLRGNPDYSSLTDEMSYSKILTTKLEAASLVLALRKREGKGNKEAEKILSSYPHYKSCL